MNTQTRIIATLIALVTPLLALAPSAAASTGSVPGRSCAAPQPQVLRLTAFGTSCAVARTLENLQAHQDPEQGFNVAGRHWSWYVYSRAQGRTYSVLVADPGRKYVQVVWCCPAS